MITEVALLPIPQLLDVLKRAEPPEGGVLSAYIDTSPGRVEGQDFLLAFRDSCRALHARLDDAQRDAFEAATGRAESFLTHQLDRSGPGIALFTSADADYFFVGNVPMITFEQVAWDTRPHMEPLVAALDELERVAVVLFDKERTRLFSIFLGRIEECKSFEDDVPGKQATGGWFGLAQTRYARHHEAHVLRHAKRTVLALADLLRAQPFDHLLIGGPDEALSVLRGQLPRVLRRRLAGTLQVEMFATEVQILRQALEAAQRAERLQEVTRVHELLEGVGTARVALGVTATLDALNHSRVHLLVVASDLTARVAECPDCRFLAREGRLCPICGGPVARAGDLRELAVEIALAQGARIEEVREEAAAVLTEHGGIGALTRY